MNTMVVVVLLVVAAMAKVAMAARQVAMVHLRLIHMQEVMVDLQGGLVGKTHMQGRGTLCMGLTAGLLTEHQTLARHTITTIR